MAQGLQVWNADGELILDLDTVTTEFLGFHSTGTTNNSFEDVNINNRQVWIILTQTTSSSSVLPKFSVTGNVISWVFEQYATGVFSQYGVTYPNGEFTFAYGVF